MDKYPKTDLEFEALFESVYKEKLTQVNYMSFKKAIVDQIRSKSYGKSIQNKGFENSLAKPRIKTKLFLGKTAGGKKVYFNVEFSKQGIKCTSTIDLMEVARQIEHLNLIRQVEEQKASPVSCQLEEWVKAILLKLPLPGFLHINTYVIIKK